MGVLAGCSGGSGGGAATTAPAGSTTVAADAELTTAVPGATWDRVEPGAVGLDADALDAIADTAEKGRSQCLVVVRDGSIAGEWDFDDAGSTATRNVFSVTKSITSILVGIAQDDGALSVDDPASQWIPEWRDTPASDITIRDLLSMDSGRSWNLLQDYSELITAGDQTAFAIGLAQEHPPGEVWAYNNAAVQTLDAVLRAATGDDVAEFADERLFGPLGMTHTSMGHDAAGNTVMYQGAESTCEDLARFGLLLLHQGRWGDDQIVSSEYVAEATGKSSTKMNAAYGWLFWMNHHGPIGNPLAASDVSSLSDPDAVVGELAPGAPADLFWAIGLGNQLVQVDPGSGTVVVRLGEGEPRPQPPTFGPPEASAVVTDAVVG